jgi:hypothetical protein
MIQVILKALTAIALQAISALGTKTMIEWALFKLADVAVNSTKTNVDNEWLAKFKEEYKKVA